MTAADPRALPFLVRRVKAMPFLAGALERHLEEFPDPTSGMSRTERQILAAVARGEATGDALMQASHAIDPRYPITDSHLVVDPRRRSRRCGFLEGAPPGTAPAAEALRAVNATVTPLGRQALAGAIDRVHEVGIDDWRGGVHLAGKGPVWRWDSRERKLDRALSAARAQTTVSGVLPGAAGAATSAALAAASTASTSASIVPSSMCIHIRRSPRSDHTHAFAPPQVAGLFFSNAKWPIHARP